MYRVRVKAIDLVGFFIPRQPFNAKSNQDLSWGFITPFDHESELYLPSLDSKQEGETNA